MILLIRGGDRSPLLALAAVLGVWVFSVSSGTAGGGETAGAGLCPYGHKAGTCHHDQAIPASGTLGYGKPGLHPGFQGFGLGYHLGYGYGGDALGVGADGGYPFYGGPGYPHPWPTLRRIGGITPFPYEGGPGHPVAGCPNFFGGVGPLAADRPVVKVESGSRGLDSESNYGGFTGMIPYPETTFAPVVTITASGEPSGGVSSFSPPIAPPAPGEVVDESGVGRTIGINAEPVIDPRGARALKVTAVFPGSAAEKAGLHASDVIQSINGFVTEKWNHLAWIIAHAAPDKLLKMSVRTPGDGAVRTLTARLP